MQLSKKLSKNLLVLIFFFGGFNFYGQLKIEKIQFESANPYSFNDIITDLDNQEKQTVFGKLTVPLDSVNKNKKLPLVIGVAGSFGWSNHHYDYLKMYQEMGIATFELNSFKSRNITTTVGSQVEITMAAMILDSYKAFEKLSNHPNIDKNKVSITGWSLGGGVTLFSAWIPLKNAINKELTFASHLAYYPPCFIDPDKVEFSSSPIHILIGELDNWTPSKPCINFIEKLKPKTNIGLTIYKDSYHSFDKKTPLTRQENAYSFSECSFRLDEMGNILMNYLNIPMSNPLLQKIGFMMCVSRGADFGGNSKARVKSYNFSKDFMSKTLLNQ